MKDCKIHCQLYCKIMDHPTTNLSQGLRDHMNDNIPILPMNSLLAKNLRDGFGASAGSIAKPAMVREEGRAVSGVQDTRVQRSQIRVHDPHELIILMDRSRVES